MNRLVLSATVLGLFLFSCGSEDDASTGAGGTKATGGSTSTGGSSSGGTAGNAGTAGSNTGGNAGSGGTAGTAGTGGSAGASGSAGSGGTAGRGAAGGGTGGAGTGGAGTGGSGTGGAGTGGTSGGSCKLATECQMSVYKAVITGEKDCYCTVCPDTPMTKVEHQKRDADWKTHCTKWATNNPCPIPKCVVPPPVACKNNQCVVATSDTK